MISISEYLIWLNDLYFKITNERTKNSIEKLIAFLKELDEKKVFDNNNAYRILKRLQKLKIKVEVRPGRTRYFMNFCYSDIQIISSKYYKLVKKGFYQNRWMSYGLSFGVFLGILIYDVSKNAIFIAIGPALGIPIGVGIGSMLDKKAERENRVLNI